MRISTNPLVEAAAAFFKSEKDILCGGLFWLYFIHSDFKKYSNLSAYRVKDRSVAGIKVFGDMLRLAEVLATPKKVSTVFRLFGLIGCSLAPLHEMRQLSDDMQKESVTFGKVNQFAQNFFYWSFCVLSLVAMKKELHGWMQPKYSLGLMGISIAISVSAGCLKKVKQLTSRIL